MYQAFPKDLSFWVLDKKETINENILMPFKGLK